MNTYSTELCGIRIHFASPFGLELLRRMKGACLLSIALLPLYVVN